MKKFLCLFAIALMIVSCGKQNSESSYIPKDAIGVMYVNLESLSKKSKDIDFKDLSISKMADETAPPQIKDFMDQYMTAENMNNTFRNELVLGFMTVDRSSGSGGLIIPIKDKASFEKMITPMLEQGPGLEKQEGVGKDKAFTVYSNREMAIGWNNETALIIAARSFAGQELIDLTNLESSDNIYATNYYKDFLDTNKDMGMHITSTPMSSLANSLLAMFSGVEVNLEDNNLSYYLNFEEDNMNAQSKLKLNKDFKSLIGYESWMSTGYDENLLNMLPENPAMVMKLSIDPTALYKHMESLQDNTVIPAEFREQMKEGLRQMNRGMKREMGMTAEEVAGIFDGSMMVALTEGTVKKDSTYSYNYEKDEYEYEVFDSKIPNMYATVAIKDTEKFETLLNLAMMQGRPQEKGKNYFMISDDAFVVIKDNVIFFTNNGEKADEIYNNGKLAANLSGFKHKSNFDNSMYMYFAPGGTAIYADMVSGMNPYARMASMGGFNIEDTYKLANDYFGESHVMMNADGMEATTYTVGEGNSLERMIMYMDAMADQASKMVQQRY